MPRPSAATIFPMAGAMAAIGSSATSGMLRGRSTFVRLKRQGFRHRRYRQMDRCRDAANTAISSTSSARPAPSITSATSPTRPDVFSTCLDPRRKIATHFREPSPRGARRRRRNGCSASAGRSGGTLAETYLRRRGVTHFDGTQSLRFHPSCFYRPDGSAETQRWPALIGVVTDLDGGVTGVHRTWLDPDLAGADHGKAPIEVSQALARRHLDPRGSLWSGR